MVYNRVKIIEKFTAVVKEKSKPIKARNSYTRGSTLYKLSSLRQNLVRAVQDALRFISMN